MIGILEIYKGYINEDGPQISEKPLFREENLIVDSAKEGVVDLLTRPPSPSSVDSETKYSYEVSNFIVQGISISPNESAFSRFNALEAASGYVTNVTGTMRWPAGTETGGGQVIGDIHKLSLNPTGVEAGKSWALLPEIGNYSLTAVNSGFPSATYVNGSLKNETFSSVTNLLHNPTFSEYSFDRTLSAASMNNILGLHELAQWDIQSCLRYRNELTVYNDYFSCGALARANILDVSSLSSLVASGYASSSDGVLRSRSWSNLTTHDTSVGVAIRQHFTPAAAGSFSPRQKDDTTLGIIAEIHAKVLGLQGTSAAVRIALKNESKNISYNASTNGSYTRNQWGGSGTPYLVAVNQDVSSTISHFFNIPHNMVNDRMTVTFSFIGSTVVPIAMSDMYFWDTGINVLDGWYYGNVCEYDTLSRFHDNDYTKPSLFLRSLGRPDLTQSLSSLPLSSTTYFSQLFKMAPNKLYTPNIWGSNKDGYGNPITWNYRMDQPPGGPVLDVAIVKKATSEYRKSNHWNYITKAKGCNPSQWTRHLPESGHAINPNTGYGYGTGRCRSDANNGFPSSSLVYDEGTWIPACSAGCNDLVETTLDTNACWHYLLPKLMPPNSFGYRSENEIFPAIAQINPKPSDLCVQVRPTEHDIVIAANNQVTVSGFAVTGEFGVPLTSEGVFKGDVLKNMYLNKSKNKSLCSPDMSMASATNFYFVMRTAETGLDLGHRYYNWSSGEWDTALSENSKFFTSSMERGSTEWASFSKEQINTTPLSGVVPFRDSASQTSGYIPQTYSGNEPYEKGWYGFGMVVSAVNEDGVSTRTNGFFKKLKFLAEEKSVVYDVPECYDWTTTGDGTTFANNWRVLNNNKDSFQDPVYPFKDVTTFPYVEYFNASGLSELPFQCVGQMGYASGSIHSKETEYQFIVACTKQDNSLSGQGWGYTSKAAQEIRVVTLNDNTTVTVPVPVSGDFFTSEPYVNAPRFDIVGYPHVQQLGKVKSSAGDYSGNYQGAHMKSPITDDTWMLWSDISGQPHNWNDACILAGNCPEVTPQERSYFPSENAFQLGTRKFLGYGSLPDVSLAQVFELGDLDLDPATDQLGFTVEYQMYDQGALGEPALYWEAQAKLDDGSVLYWRDLGPSSDSYSISYGNPVGMNEGQKARTWVHSKLSQGAPINVFTTWAQQGGGGVGPYTYKTLRIRSIDLSDSRLTPTTKIRIGLKENSLKQEDVLSFKNWDFYRVTAPPSPDSLPVFPSPIDLTVQPATTYRSGEKGHFTNKIQMLSSLAPAKPEPGSKYPIPYTFNKTLAEGGWAPASSVGAFVDGNLVSGVANKFGVVNSEGMLYKIPPGETNISTLFLNGVSSTVSSLGGGHSAMMYIADVSSSDIDFFDLYGGIGAIGLWTLNSDETMRSFVKNGHSTTTNVFDLSAYPYTTSLYNVTDVTRNPVFRLFSKKVFKTPLQKGVSDFFRIKWYIQLV